MRMGICAVSLAVAVVAGCASQRKLPEPMPTGKVWQKFAASSQPAEKVAVAGQEDMSRLLDAPGELRLPAALALVKVMTASYSSPSLSMIDSTELADWREAAAIQPQINDVRAMPTIAIDPQKVTLDSLRSVAARMKCELLLVYVQSDSQVSNFNVLAPLYWTFVGLWLVPGDELEHKTVMEAILLDTRTGAILGTAAGDSHQTRVSAAAYDEVARASLNKQVPAEALARLQANCRPLFAGKARANPRPAQP